MYFYAARQPILDTNQNIFGYELLYRDSINNVFPNIDGDEATSKMIEASKFNMGMSEFTNNKFAFINFTLETLVQGYPEMLTNKEVVIEVLETIKPGKKLLGLCKDLHSKGYIIALDDYEHQGVWAHFYPFIQIIKVDVQKTAFSEVDKIIEATTDYPHIKLLAEKIETVQEYEKAQQLGFSYFQGYFFARPEMVKTKSLSPSQLTMAELLYETSKPNLDLAGITQVFERDISLSYKLLRYANTAALKRNSKVSSIKEALVIIGSAELKRFLCLMFAVTTTPEEPNKLIKLAMARAKFCELVTDELSDETDTSIAFLTGLLSIMDKVLDRDLAVILANLPLTDEIKAPLLTHKGLIATIITLAQLIEHAKWDKTTSVMKELKLEKSQAADHYNKSLVWANQQSSSLIS